MPVTAFNGNGLVSKLEILRGDLVDVLYQATKDSAEYRFGTSISDVTQADDGAEVTFADGTVLRADLVVGADGPHSAVRRLVFGPEEQFVKPIGGYNAWFSAPDSSDWTAGFCSTRLPADSTHRCARHTTRRSPRRGSHFSQSQSPMTGATSTSSARSWSIDSPARGGNATRCWPQRRKPTTSTSTPSPRSTCRLVVGSRRRWWVTPGTAHHR